MTRRERKERNLERRAQWAASRDAKARAGFNRARVVADGIPLGQPILVGHHSEKRHRADIARIDAGMRQGVESEKMAQHHRSVADGIARQLDVSIYSDDTDAVEALEARITAREAARERMVLVNRLYRKGDAAGLAALGLDLERLRRQCAEAGPYFGKQPHMPYELSNLGGRITADRKRLEIIKAEQARAAKAQAAPDGLLVQYHAGQDFTVIPCPVCGGGEYAPADGTVDDRERADHDRSAAAEAMRDCGRCGGSGRQGEHVSNPIKYVSLTFAEKPARAILDALRSAGFRWGGGRWTGETAKLPAGILPAPGEALP